MQATTAPLNTRQEIGHHHPDQALNAETPHAYTSHHLSPADRDANDVASCIEYNDVVENSFDSSGSLEMSALSQFTKSSPIGAFCIVFDLQLELIRYQIVNFLMTIV